MSFLYTKASFNYLVAIEGSSDRTIKELAPLLDSPANRNNIGIPELSFDIIKDGRRIVSTVPSLKHHCKKSITDLKAKHWNHHLQTLTVQNKFLNITSLESTENVWSKLMRMGLPQGQLSFLLKAGSDTLPTAMNLRRMKIQ